MCHFHQMSYFAEYLTYSFENVALLPSLESVCVSGFEESVALVSGELRQSPVGVTWPFVRRVA